MEILMKIGAVCVFLLIFLAIFGIWDASEKDISLTIIFILMSILSIIALSSLWKETK